MSANSKKIKITALLLLSILSVYFLAEYLTTKRTTDLKTGVEKSITEQRTILAELSEVTGRNGADATTDATVRDCTLEERKEFDVLLGRLDEGLSQTELLKLDRLFGRCGYFFAQRKSIMVARLAREVEVYEHFVTQLETLTGATKKEAYAVELWKQLVYDEQKQTDLFMNLVKTQDRIIATLISGKSADSEDMQVILAEVKETQGTLSVTNKQTADLRAQLLTQ